MHPNTLHDDESRRDSAYAYKSLFTKRATHTEVGTKKNRTGKDDFVALVIFAVPGLYQIVFTSVLLQYNTTLAFG